VQTIYGIPVVFCFGLAAITPPIFFACGFLSSLLLRVAELISDSANTHFAVIGVSHSLQRFLTAVALFLPAMLLAHDLPESITNYGRIVDTTFRLGLVCIIFYGVSLVSVLACRMMSLRVHATSLLARLKVRSNSY
jgi:hypothetical protein